MLNPDHFKNYIENEEEWDEKSREDILLPNENLKLLVSGMVLDLTDEFMDDYIIFREKWEITAMNELPTIALLLNLLFNSFFDTISKIGDNQVKTLAKNLKKTVKINLTDLLSLFFSLLEQITEEKTCDSFRNNKILKIEEIKDYSREGEKRCH